MSSELNPIQTLITYLSHQNQDKSTQEIGDALEMNRNLVSKYLSILHMQGRVELRTYGTLKMYRLANRVPFQSISDIIDGTSLGFDRLLIVKEVGNDPEPFFSQSAPALIGKRYSDVMHPCFQDEIFLRELKLILEGKKKDTSCFEFWKGNASHLVKIYPTVFFDGSPGIAASFIDNTKEKEIQIELENLHSQYLSITQNCQEMILHLSPNKQILYANSSYAQNVDQDPEQIIGTIYEPVIPTEDVKQLNKLFTSLTEKNPTKTIDHRVVMKDGSVRWQKWVVTALYTHKDISEYYLSGTDTTKLKLMESQIHQFELGLENILKEKTDELREVTRNLYKEIEDRKRLEREISEKEELFRNLTESTSDIVWETDAKGIFLYINPVFCHTLGYSHEEIIGKSLYSFLQPENADLLRTIFHNSLEKNETFHQIDLPFLQKDGNTSIIELSGVVSSDSNGKTAGIRGIGRDITLRKKSEIEKEKLLAIIEQSPELIGICDISGMIQYLNPTGLKMLDIPEETEISKLSIDTFVHARSRPNIANAIKIAVKHGHWKGETNFITWNGKEIPVSQVIVSHQPVPNEPPILFTISHDISELIYHDRELSRLSAYSQNLIEASLDPLVTINHDGTIQGVNTATEQVVGLSRDELIGTDFDGYFQDPLKANEAIVRAFSDGFIRDYRMELKHQDGHVTPVLFNASVYRDENGKIQGVFAAARDMSNLYHIEAELRESLEYYLQILDEFPNPIWRSGVDTHFNYFNTSWFDFTGRTFDQEMGKGWQEGIHPDDMKRYTAEFDSAFRNRLPFSLQYRLRYHDGSYHWLIDHGVPLYSKNGVFSGYIGSCYDIDKIIKAEENIRISEKKYRQLHDSMMDGYVSIDLQGNIQECNEAYKEMVGYETDELVHLNVRNLTPEKWHKIDEDINGQVFIKGYSPVYEKEYRHNNGTVFPIELRKVLLKDDLGNPVAIWAIVRDITDRKEVEKSLIENKNNLLLTQIQLITQNEALKKNNEEISRLEARYRSLFEYSPSGYIILDDTGTVCEINPEGLKYLGCSFEEITGRKLESFIEPSQVQRYYHFFEKLCDTGNHQSVELQLLKNKQYPFFAYLQGNVIKSGTDDTDQIQISLIDISQAKIAEDKLKESEAKYRLLADNSMDVIWLLDVGSERFTYVSPAIYKLLGYTPEEIMANSLDKILTKEAYEKLRNDIPSRIRAYESGDESSRVAITEIDIPYRDGTPIHTEVVTTLIRDQDLKISKILGATRNITARKIAERKSAQSQEYYRILFESSYYGVIFINEKGLIVSSNPAAERILGASQKHIQDMLYGRSCVKIIHEDGSPFPLESYPCSLAMQTGKVFKNVTMGIFNLQLNRYIWIKISAIPLFRQNEGMPYQVYTIFEDITTEKNLEKTVQNWHDQAVLLTQFLENSIQPFGISYLDGTLWYVNQALARLLQSSVEDISLSANMGTGSSPNWLKIDLEEIQFKGKSQKHGKVTRTLLRKDGVEIPVEIFANLISDETGEPVYYYLLINEITAVRKISDP